MTLLGNKLRILREERDLTKPELAQRLGVTTPAIYHLERGIRKPSIAMMVRLADFFSVSIDELARLADEEADKTTHPPASMPVA